MNNTAYTWQASRLDLQNKTHFYINPYFSKCCQFGAYVPYLYTPFPLQACFVLLEHVKQVCISPLCHCFA